MVEPHTYDALMHILLEEMESNKSHGGENETSHQCAERHLISNEIFDIVPWL